MRSNRASYVLLLHRVLGALSTACLLANLACNPPGAPSTPAINPPARVPRLGEYGPAAIPVTAVRVLNQPGLCSHIDTPGGQRNQGSKLTNAQIQSYIENACIFYFGTCQVELVWDGIINDLRTDLWWSSQWQPRQGRCQYHFWSEELLLAQQYGWVSEDRITIFFHGAQMIDTNFDMTGDDYAPGQALEPDNAGWVEYPGAGQVFISPYILINDWANEYAPGRYFPERYMLEHEFGHYLLRLYNQRGYDGEEHYNDGGENLMNYGPPVKPRFHSAQDILDIYLQAFMFNVP